MLSKNFILDKYEFKHTGDLQSNKLPFIQLKYFVIGY